ncbi:MAG: hypothetical protein CSYNP_03750 [Syntrophus sp. SKADARSKE-3]|nr:hypothetical protein [Syntrophus sp. SKADARSKE-3]
MSEDKEKYKELLEETLNLYNIPPCFVLAWRYDVPTDSMVVVTHGGKKIKHKIGAQATCTLTETEISGFLPQKEMFWNEKLNGRVSIDELINK